MMFFLKMFFQEGNGRKLLIIFTGLSIKLNKAFILSEFFECIFALLSSIENISINFIRYNLSFDRGKCLKLGHNNNLFTIGLKYDKRYLAYGTITILTDNSHLIDTSITNGLMVTFSHSNELCLFDT